MEDISLYYEILFTLSLILSMAYVFVWHKHFDVHITILYVLIPIVNMGYVFRIQSENLEEALMANKLVYLGGCYLILFVLLSILELCDINVSRKFSVVLILISTVIYSFALSTGDYDIFYKSVSFDISDPTHLAKEYAFGHTCFYIMVIAYFVAGLVAIIYSLKMKSQVSDKTLWLLFMTQSIAIVAFFIGKVVTIRYELTPLAYVIAQIIFLDIINRINLYDIMDTGIDSLVETGDTGFASFDFKLNYLGSNATAKSVIPELGKFHVDSSIEKAGDSGKEISEWISSFKENNENNRFYYKKDDKTYLVEVRYLFDGVAKRGYQLFIKDDTIQQKYIATIKNYNSDLKAEVKKQTKSILDMHDRLIMSMAMMVESRDNSTGGHIRRTSDVVRMIVDEMRKDNVLKLSEEFFEAIIKAAPMHDLGKIAVDDEILRKPGRFTPEEFDKMKKHAEEGARIVHEILKGTDDKFFHRIAENVAHYHHERYDGSGYPKGLKGDDIPLEARIMAVADVYDALVSKRVYKESMSFEEADKIIMEGMGKHFDKRLEPYYIKARPALEAYYRSEDQGEEA